MDSPWHLGEEWDLLDFYSGKGRMSILANKVGYHAAAFELLLDQRVGKSKAQRKQQRASRSFMDMNGEVGHTLLAHGFLLF